MKKKRLSEICSIILMLQPHLAIINKLEERKTFYSRVAPTFENLNAIQKELQRIRENHGDYIEEVLEWVTKLKPTLEEQPLSFNHSEGGYIVVDANIVAE